MKRIENTKLYEPKKREQTEKATSTGAQVRTTRSAIQIYDQSMCIICQKVKKLPSNRRKEEPVHLLTLTSAVQTLIKAAEIRKDEKVLMELRGGARGAVDPIAGGILIHRFSDKISFLNSVGVQK